MGIPIVPITDDNAEQTALRLTIAPMLEPDDGSAWAFNGTGYDKIVEPWTVEQHIKPINSTEKFGDVESFVSYVKEFGGEGENLLLTWGERGLKAIMDYHHTDGTPQRCQWLAEHPFELASQWKAWQRLCTGAAMGQRQLVESLEDLGDDIVDPQAGDLLELLRTLRGTANSTAATKLNADGSTAVDFKSNTAINAGKDEKAKLPPTITIAVPVLKGHTEEQDGRQVPVLYRLPVRLRASVDDNTRLQFRLSMPTSDRVLEAVYADRVAAAKTLLGDAYTLLRAAS